MVSRCLCLLNGPIPLQSHPLALVIFFAFQIGSEMIYLRQELLGDSSSDKWISHNSKRALPTLKETNRAKYFPILKAKSSPVHTLGMLFMIRKSQIWAAASVNLSMGDEEERRLKLMWEMSVP